MFNRILVKFDRLAIFVSHNYDMCSRILNFLSEHGSRKEIEYSRMNVEEENND